MTDDEFDLLDELYFVQPFGYLKETLAWPDERILYTLRSLHENAFIKYLYGPDEEVFEPIDVMEKGKDLYYLATKKGLLEHNAL